MPSAPDAVGADQYVAHAREPAFPVDGRLERMGGRDSDKKRGSDRLCFGRALARLAQVFEPSNTRAGNSPDAANPTRSLGMMVRPA
jgi:hypothetical protein